MNKKAEMKERLKRIIKIQRDFLINTLDTKEGIETASLDLAQMISMIPEEDLLLFGEIITELEQENKRE